MWWTQSKRCCLKRSDCCLPPTPVYFLEDSGKFYELLSPVLRLLSFTVLQLVKKISGNTVVPILRRYVRVRQSYSNLFKGYTLRCGDFTMEQKLKQRICIDFCVKLQISATETFEMLNKVFPNDTPKRTTVFK
ncbi:hypothetical protein LAZ67_17000663 [Cordylochernes scorpioides]|uniref:Ribosomal protein S10 n=1 Tax=Cordylochernes scorpioides TaxID=51811 RepID=A0ABY6LCX5_9ARAC|nr:hypothetical protein LAZ67_17000663 [Cordylochernes scorpioides]